MARHEARLVAEVEHITYDEEYVAYQRRNHGGIPRRQWFVTESGTKLRLGRFVNYGGPYAKPYIDCWESSGTDVRARTSIFSLESYGNIDEGCDVFLLAFGLLYQGDHHPDEMQLTYSDLVCFDYSNPGAPTVVAWNNSAALAERHACLEDGRDPRTEMDHSKFTEPVANDFTTFLSCLRADEP